MKYLSESLTVLGEAFQGEWISCHQYTPSVSPFRRCTIHWRKYRLQTALQAISRKILGLLPKQKRTFD